MHIILFLSNWLPDNLFFIRLRGWLVSPFFNKCGKKLGVGRNVTFYNPSKIILDTNVYRATGSWFSANEFITIEDQVLVGPYSVVVSSNHSRIEGSLRFGSPKMKPICLKKVCWLGAHSTVTSGSIVGEGTLVSANSLVIGTLNNHSHHCGVPAVFFKSYTEIG